MKAPILLIIATLLIPAANASDIWERDLGNSAVNISIINEYGSIELVPSENGNLTISGPDGEISVNEDSTGLQLSVTAPPEGSRHTNITIRVPRMNGRQQLTVKTAGGTITSRELTEMPMHFHTKTGNITIIPQLTSNFDVLLRTSGDITSDYSIDIEQQWDTEPSKTGHIMIGEGGVPMKLESRRGTIAVLRR